MARYPEIYKTSEWESFGSLLLSGRIHSVNPVSKKEKWPFKSDTAYSDADLLESRTGHVLEFVSNFCLKS